MQLNRLAFLAVAFIAPSGITSSVYAQPDPVQPVEQKKPPKFIFPLMQVVGVDAQTQTIRVLTAKTTDRGENGIPAITIGVYETITLPLSPQVSIRQMHNEAHCDCSFPASLKEVGEAQKENRRIEVSLGKTDDGQQEVRQIMIFAGPQKPIAQLFKEHFKIGPVS